MQVDPKTSMYINIAIAVLGVLAAAGAYFTTMFGQDIGQKIVMSIGLVLGIISAINGVLHGTSSPNAGPLVKP